MAHSESYELHSRFFGRRIATEYSSPGIGIALVGLRLMMGWVLLQAGVVKLIEPSWSAAPFLSQEIPRNNPFAAQFAGLAGSPAVDWLVQWGLTLTGLGLIVGALVRWNAFLGAVLMLLFWAANLEGGLAQGLPTAYGWLVDEHIVYAMLLFGLGAFGAGRLYGADALLEDLPVVVRFPWLKLLLG